MNIEQKQVYCMLLVSVYNGVNLMVQTSSEVTARKSLFCIHHFSTLGSSLLKFVFFLDFFFIELQWQREVKIQGDFAVRCVTLE